MTDPISARITAQIRTLRQSLSVTRDELASLARAAGAPDSFTVAALRNVEIGRRPLAVDELVWLATALSVPPRQLLGEAAALFGAAEDKPPDFGPVEAATRRAVQGLDGLDGRQLALAEVTYALARKLDEDAGMAAAAVAKQLSAALAEIWAGADSDDDDEDFGPS